MPEREERRFPEWAERERARDLVWIQENLFIFWPVAQQAFEEVGRGAIVVDTTIQLEGAGNPFGYFERGVIEQTADEDTLRMLAEYDPTWEMVTVLLKTHERTSTYRIGVLNPDADG